MYDRISHSNTTELKEMAAKAALFMHEEAAPDASILIVEPGIPQSGKFISFLREAFIELGHPPAAPCTHDADCPLTPQRHKIGLKQRWCHFAFNAAETPKELKRLSTAARLPKERLVFSFLLTGSKTKTQKHKALSRKKAESIWEENIRIISDAFPLPNHRFGRYGCSASGLVLLTGEKNQIEKLESFGYIEQNKQKTYIFTGNERDVKSGALILELK
jgi:hypothetical protein